MFTSSQDCVNSGTKKATVILSEKLCDRCGTENSLLYIEIKEGKKINLCNSCIHELFSTEKETEKESLLDNPKDICNQCLKFLDDGHYDNDPNMLPLYIMLGRLQAILSKQDSK